MALATLQDRVFIADFHFVEQRVKELFHVPEADLFASLQRLFLSVDCFRMDKVKPILLLAVMQQLEVLPMGAHNFFVVMADERLEDLAVVWVARVDLCEKAVH